MPLIIIKTSVSNLSTGRKNFTWTKPSCTFTFCKIPRLRDVHFGASLKMSLGNSKAPVAYIEIKNVGILSPEVTSELNEVSNIIETLKPVDRMYTEFQESQSYLWGYDGSWMMLQKLALIPHKFLLVITQFRNLPFHNFKISLHYL